jgi:hypothetical protein
MTRAALALLALVPAAVLAQSPVDRAREARTTANEANAQSVERADAAAKDAAGAPAAEAAPPGDGLPATGIDEGAYDIGQGEGSARAADEGGGEVPAPDTYTVRPGDTLWDLSGRFLNNPWYWPKVWSYNPEISNPNWIYPGNVIRFFPSAEEAPARVEPIAEAGAPEGQAEDAAPPRELEDFSKADMKADEADEDTVAVVGPYKIGYVPPKAMLAQHVTFVTKGELERSGTLTGAFEEKLMLSTWDKSYAHFQGSAPVKAGQTYLVYKTDRAIYHPSNKLDLIGYQSTILGAAKVTAVDDTAVSLVITSCFEPIARGAMLGPWNERFLRKVARKPNQVSLDGLIVGAQVEVVTEIGEHHVVFVNRGKKDGVEIGNVFTAVRSGDPYGKPNGPLRDPAFPKEDVGDLMVIDAQDAVSTALVIRSMREMAVGDQVELRAAAGAGGK